MQNVQDINPKGYWKLVEKFNDVPKQKNSIELPLIYRIKLMN